MLHVYSFKISINLHVLAGLLLLLVVVVVVAAAAAAVVLLSVADLFMDFGLLNDPFPPLPTFSLLFSMINFHDF
jgi:hypothetical protein